MKTKTLFCTHFFISVILGFFSTVNAQMSLSAEHAQRLYIGQWIWCPVVKKEPFQFVRFSKVVELDVHPVNATLYIAADTFYRLWINERLVMHGPARSSRGKATIDPVDVSRYLVVGKNAIMIEVLYGVFPFEALSQAPGLLCELEADFGNRKQRLAVTDETWHAAEITAWSRESLRFNFQRGWVEQYDAQKIREERLQAVNVLGKVGVAPWLTVELRDVPMPAPLKEVRPVSVMAVQRGDGSSTYFHGPETRIEPKAEWDARSEWFQRLHTEKLKDEPEAASNPQGLTAQGQGDTLLNGEGASIAYDMGRGYVGFIGFEVTGKAGQVLEVAWADGCAADGSVRPCAQTGRNAIRFTLREGRQCFLAFMPQFIRFLRIEQRGSEIMRVHRLGVTEFRFDDTRKGDFTCSDDAINHIYQAAKWTAALNTLDVYMDCPHRERSAMYGVEGYWMQKAVYTFFGDTRVSRRSIQCGADSVADPEGIDGPPAIVHVTYPIHLKFFSTIIPTQPLFWVLHAALYERCSGDTVFIRSLLPAIRNNLSSFDVWRNSDGLLESIPSWMFFDYADIRTDGVSVALNSIYAKTLDVAAGLEERIGDQALAQIYIDRARKVRDALNRLCPHDAFYPDVLARDNQGQLKPSIQACETTQYFALWSDLPPAERAQQMWKGLRNDFLPTPLQKIQPINGLTRAGLYPFLARLEVAAKGGDHAALMRDTKAMFLPMVQRAPGTLWEDPMGKIALCHAIGCGIGGVLTEEILGIRFGFPLRITPHSGGSLQWAKGFITTPKGEVHVAWNCGRERYQLQVTLPKGLSAQLVLPPEAKAIWQTSPSSTGWQDTLSISADTVFVITPGRVEKRLGADPDDLNEAP